MNKNSIAFSVVFIGLLTGPVIADGTKSGAELFEFHGCTNCHGGDAKSPISKVVPSLTGKPADQLYANAKKILHGKGATEASKLMHSAMYSPSQCDNPPTDEELRAITTWVSQQ